MACGRECAVRSGASGANADAHGVDYNAEQIDSGGKCTEPEVPKIKERMSIGRQARREAESVPRSTVRPP